jgi:hypothetical protein
VGTLALFADVLLITLHRAAFPTSLNAFPIPQFIARINPLDLMHLSIKSQTLR